MAYKRLKAHYRASHSTAGDAPPEHDLFLDARMGGVRHGNNRKWKAEAKVKQRRAERKKLKTVDE
jgi:hypothetical protein